MVFHGFTHGYERRGILNLEEVFGRLGEHIWRDGLRLSLHSPRLAMFRDNPACVRCGLEGLYFAMERSAKQVKTQVPGTGRHERVWRACKNTTDRQWHLNLYAMREDGTEVLMTKDHIHPRSLGGPNELGNYQTMCQPCNGKKGNGKPQPSMRRVRREEGADGIEPEPQDDVRAAGGVGVPQVQEGV